MPVVLSFLRMFLALQISSGVEVIWVFVYKFNLKLHAIPTASTATCQCTFNYDKPLPVHRPYLKQSVKWL